MDSNRIPEQPNRASWAKRAVAVLLLVAITAVLAFALRVRIRRFIQSDSTPPTAPTGLVVESGGTAAEPQFTLKWEAAEDNIGVTRYLVFRDADEQLAVLDADELTFTDRLVEPGAVHGYQIAAMDDRGNPSARTSPVEGRSIGAPGPDLERPEAPEGLEAEVSGGRVVLEWEPSDDDVGVTRYVVFRSVDIEVGEVDGDTTTFTEVGVNDGTHTYQVAAFDDAGRFSVRSERVKVEVGTKQETATRRGN